MAAVESSFKHNFLKQIQIRIRKFSALKNRPQITKTPKAIQSYEKFFVNLSEDVSTESKESALKKGLNFVITNKLPNLDVFCGRICKVQTSPRLGYEVLLEDPTYIGEIKTSYI
jgi:hypothetical protein